MKKANRKPRINKKPSKGMKMFLKQGRKAFDKTIESVFKQRQHWYTHRQLRDMWLIKLRGSHMPHQSGKEKARRVRQMISKTHGYPTQPDSRETYPIGA